MTLRINPVLCRAGTMDNYAYILVDEETQIAAVVDASEAAPIIERCQELNITPRYILTTHHHFDHVGGNEALKEKYALKIIGAAAEKDLIPGLDEALSEHDTFSLGKSTARIIAAPGHTRGHILWYFSQDKALFTGDVLFNLCIGGLFEGTSQQMWESLEKIKALPDDTNFYPGHEYTKHCLHNVLKTESGREYAAYARQRLAENLPVAPVSLGLEKKCNPYLQFNDPNVFARLF